MSICSMPWHKFTSVWQDEESPTVLFGASPTGSSGGRSCANPWRTGDVEHGATANSMQVELLHAEVAHLKHALVREMAAKQLRNKRHCEELDMLHGQRQAAFACMQQDLQNKLEHSEQQATCIRALLDELLMAQEADAAVVRAAREQTRRADGLHAQLAAAASAQAAAECEAAQARRRMEETAQQLRACKRQADAAGARAAERATARAASLAAELVQLKQDLAAMQAAHEQQLAGLEEELNEYDASMEELELQVKERDQAIERLQGSCKQMGVMLQDANRARSQTTLPVVRLSQLKLKRVAAGGYSTVYRTTISGRDAAVKLINPADRVSLLEEVTKAQQCKGVAPEVICLIEDDVCLFEGTACLRGFAMEWWDGNLEDLLRRMARTSDGRPAHLRKLQWCLQLTELMQRVHGSRIAHLDLKAANILYRITSSGGLEFCLTDLGLAQRMMDDGTVDKEPLGTISHNDPDVAPDSLGRYHGAKFDMYSLGRTFLQIVLSLRAFTRDWCRRLHIDASGQQTLRPMQLRALLQDSFQDDSSSGGGGGCSTSTSTTWCTNTSSSSGSSSVSSIGTSTGSGAGAGGSSSFQGSSSSGAQQALLAGWVALLESMTGAAYARPTMGEVADALRALFRRHAVALAKEATKTKAQAQP